jgi:arabinose-5-phosphate isomerase
MDNLNIPAPVNYYPTQQQANQPAQSAAFHAAAEAPEITTDSPVVADARKVLQIEAEAILDMRERLSLEFEQAIELLLLCTGKVVVTGMGKSGHIGSKLAATLASTGTPAFFVHPAELRHGDFGMLEERDLVLAISSSGETQEIKLALDPIKRLGIKIISLTGNKNSTLAHFSDVVLDVAVSREACPFNLAPTSSTTATLAMGDALAIVLMTKKKFRVEDYARAHPGGSLGQRLVTVQDVMRSGQDLPAVEAHAAYYAVLNQIDQKRLGFTAVCDSEKRLIGIITDGDLRRALLRWDKQVFEKKASELMSPNPKTISANSLAVEALRLMEKHSISDLLITDDERRPTGLIHLKDLLHAGII